MSERLAVGDLLVAMRRFFGTTDIPWSGSSHTVIVNKGTILLIVDSRVTKVAAWYLCVSTQGMVWIMDDIIDNDNALPWKQKMVNVL